MFVQDTVVLLGEPVAQRVLAPSLHDDDHENRCGDDYADQDENEVRKLHRASPRSEPPDVIENVWFSATFPNSSVATQRRAESVVLHARNLP